MLDDLRINESKINQNLTGEDSWQLQWAIDLTYFLQIFSTLCCIFFVFSTCPLFLSLSRIIGTEILMGTSGISVVSGFGVPLDFIKQVRRNSVCLILSMRPLIIFWLNSHEELVVQYEHDNIVDRILESLYLELLASGCLCLLVSKFSQSSVFFSLDQSLSLTFEPLFYLKSVCILDNISWLVNWAIMVWYNLLDFLTVLYIYILFWIWCVMIFFLSNFVFLICNWVTGLACYHGIKLWLLNIGPSSARLSAIWFCWVLTWKHLSVKRDIEHSFLP